MAKLRKTSTGSGKESKPRVKRILKRDAINTKPGTMNPDKITNAAQTVLRGRKRKASATSTAREVRRVMRGSRKGK